MSERARIEWREHGPGRRLHAHADGADRSLCGRPVPDPCASAPEDDDPRRRCRTCERVIRLRFRILPRRHLARAGAEGEASPTCACDGCRAARREGARWWIEAVRAAVGAAVCACVRRAVAEAAGAAPLRDAIGEAEDEVAAVALAWEMSGEPALRERAEGARTYLLRVWEVAARIFDEEGAGHECGARRW